MKFAKVTICYFMILIIATGCSYGNSTKSKDVPNENKQTDQKSKDQKNEKDQKTDEKPKVYTKEEKIQIKLDKMLGEMTLGEKVGQLFMVAFRVDQEKKPILELQDTQKKAIKDTGFGGIALFGENVQSPDQLKKLVKDMQGASKIPLFIGIDEEGGNVSRIGSNPAMGEKSLPNMKEIGDSGALEAAYDVGDTLGKTLKKYGINMDFAPVADVNTNPNNPIIGVRSFGEDAKLVADMVVQVIKGLEENGVSACAKHFPGHGDTQSDSHKGQVQISQDLEGLKKVEWQPFKAAIKEKVDFIMVGHINTPNATTENIPATVNKQMMDYLRQDLGFKGLIITDALEMKAISDYYTSGEACIRAFKAGADILLMPLSWQEGYEAMVMAFNSGQIQKDRLDESVTRILKLKIEKGLLPLE